MVLKLGKDGTFVHKGYGRQMVWWQMKAVKNWSDQWVWDPWFLGYFR